MSVATYFVTDGYFSRDVIDAIAARFSLPAPPPFRPVPTAPALGIEPAIDTGPITVFGMVDSMPQPGNEFHLLALARRTPGFGAIWQDLTAKVGGWSDVPWAKGATIKEAGSRLDLPDLSGWLWVSEVDEPERSIRAMERYVGLDGHQSWADRSFAAQLWRMMGF
jgi:hypothetical protein